MTTPPGLPQQTLASENYNKESYLMSEAYLETTFAVTVEAQMVFMDWFNSLV